jgi:hypothetical protein
LEADQRRQQDNDLLYLVSHRLVPLNAREDPFGATLRSSLVHSGFSAEVRPHPRAAHNFSSLACLAEVDRLNWKSAHRTYPRLEYRVDIVAPE